MQRRRCDWRDCLWVAYFEKLRMFHRMQLLASILEEQVIWIDFCCACVYILDNGSDCGGLFWVFEAGHKVIRFLVWPVGWIFSPIEALPLVYTLLPSSFCPPATEFLKHCPVPQGSFSAHLAIFDSLLQAVPPCVTVPSYILSVRGGWCYLLWARHWVKKVDRFCFWERDLNFIRFSLFLSCVFVKFVQVSLKGRQFSMHNHQHCVAMPLFVPLL